MKRHPALQPLSREHHTALVLASACERAAESGDGPRLAATCERAVRAFEQELEPHFQMEEQSLLPLLNGPQMALLLQRTLDEHQQLRELLGALRQGDATALGSFGAALKAHVRFEERELFPALEGLLGEGGS
ncbi:MAG: hemerythrin domain-containing protein [Gammaproteobacteria bacterium]|nr:hemerythrin domain-containing protein [Gammaproteobacteria bacterium]